MSEHEKRPRALCRDCRKRVGSDRADLIVERLGVDLDAEAAALRNLKPQRLTLTEGETQRLDEVLGVQPAFHCTATPRCERQCTVCSFSAPGSQS